MIRYNALGGTYLGLSMLAGGFVWLLLDVAAGLPAHAAVFGCLIAGTTAIALDGRFRAKQGAPGEAARFFHPHEGGHITFLPIWVYGVIAIVAAALQVPEISAKSSRSQPSPPDRFVSSSPGTAVEAQDLDSVLSLGPKPTVSPFQVAEIFVAGNRPVIGEWVQVSELAPQEPFYVMVVATWCPHSKTVLDKLQELTEAGDPWDIYEIQKENLAESIRAQVESGDLTPSQAGEMNAFAVNRLSRRILSMVAVYTTEYSDFIRMALDAGELQGDRALELLERAQGTKKFLFDDRLFGNVSYSMYAIKNETLREEINGFPSTLCCVNGSCVPVMKEDCTAGEGR